MSQHTSDEKQVQENTASATPTQAYEQADAAWQAARKEQAKLKEGEGEEGEEGEEDIVDATRNKSVQDLYHLMKAAKKVHSDDKRDANRTERRQNLQERNHRRKKNDHKNYRNGDA